MPVILERDDARLVITDLGWTLAARLAGRYGGPPAQSLIPGCGRRSCHRPRERTLDADASGAIAQALRAALPDVPDFDAWPALDGRAPTLFEALSGPRRIDLARIADHCAAGPVRVRRCGCRGRRDASP